MSLINADNEKLLIERHITEWTGRPAQVMLSTTKLNSLCLDREAPCLSSMVTIRSQY